MFSKLSITKRTLWLIALLASSTQAIYPQGNADPSPHTITFVSVEPDVKLEVLDWGGVGRPLVFLAGLGNTAHVYDSFAPKFTANHHVYGVTRRGFGASSKPTPFNNNYAADHLGDDVLAVIEALKLDRPILIGHSLAGEELSSIGSRHPEKVGALIYLDAGYGYAFYDSAHGDVIFDFFQLKKHLDDFMSGAVHDQNQFAHDLSLNVSQFNKALQELMQQGPSASELHAPPSPVPPIIAAINLGAQKYAEVHVPVLAIFACPHNLDFIPDLKENPTLKAQAIAHDLVMTTRQAKAFEAGIPSAHVVLIPDASHYVFRSNEADVLREMNSFLAKIQ
jgi:non-heme chloroperoxidase